MAWVCVGVYMYLSKMTASLIVCICPSLSSQIGVTTALLTTIVGVISVNQTWGQEWDVVPISLQVSSLKHRKVLNEQLIVNLIKFAGQVRYPNCRSFYFFD